MVGWHLLLLLVVEAALYGAVARHVQFARGWSPFAAVALALAIYLCVRIILVGAEFVLARRKGTPIPESLRVTPMQVAGTYLRELGGWLLMFSLVLPFVLSRRSVIDRPAGPPSDEFPVLLVHGLSCNRGNWFWFRRRLERRGYRVYTLDYTPPLARIASYAPQVARAIDEVLAAAGAGQLVLVGHSMGGLVARAYLDQFGGDKIRHVITLGTPHLGTWMARLALGPNLRDMDLDSVWLEGLREREAARSPRPYANFTCLCTYHDNLVTPQTNAMLPGAESIALSGVGHLSLGLSERVVGKVAGVLERLALAR